MIAPDSIIAEIVFAPENFHLPGQAELSELFAICQYEGRSCGLTLGTLIGKLRELLGLRVRGVVSAVDTQLLVGLRGRLDGLSFELFQTKPIVGVDPLDLMK